jgi:hypothetical protein
MTIDRYIDRKIYRWIHTYAYDMVDRYTCVCMQIHITYTHSYVYIHIHTYVLRERDHKQMIQL